MFYRSSESYGARQGPSFQNQEMQASNYEEEKASQQNHFIDTTEQDGPTFFKENPLFERNQSWQPGKNFNSGSLLSFQLTPLRESI